MKVNFIILVFVAITVVSCGPSKLLTESRHTADSKFDAGNYSGSLEDLELIINQFEGKGKNADVAVSKETGKKLAEKAKAAGIEKVVFDRGGYRYHGQVKALADGAREGGLKF